MLLLWTCAFAYAQSVSYFSLLHNILPSDKMYDQWHEILFFSFPTCYFCELCITYAQQVSYFSLLHNIYHSDNMYDQWHFSFSPLAPFVNLCDCLCAQRVSYFSLLHNIDYSDKMYGLSLSPLATFVNVCICLCSASKLLFFAS